METYTNIHTGREYRLLGLDFHPPYIVYILEDSITKESSRVNQFEIHHWRIS